MRRVGTRTAASKKAVGPPTAEMLHAKLVPPPPEVETVWREPQRKLKRATGEGIGFPSNPKQLALCREYIKNYDIEAAAKASGYCNRKDKIMDVLARLGPFMQIAQEEKAREIGRRGVTSQKKVLDQLAAEAHYSEVDFVQKTEEIVDGKLKITYRQKALHELDEWQHMLVTDIRFLPDGTATYSLPDRMEARKLIGRHLGMFSEKLAIEHQHRQMQGEKADLGSVPDDELAKIEGILLQHLGPQAKRSIGEYYSDDADDFDAAAGKL